MERQEQRQQQQEQSQHNYPGANISNFSSSSRRDKSINITIANDIIIIFWVIVVKNNNKIQWSGKNNDNNSKNNHNNNLLAIWSPSDTLRTNKPTRRRRRGSLTIVNREECNESYSDVKKHVHWTFIWSLDCLTIIMLCSAGPWSRCFLFRVVFCLWIIICFWELLSLPSCDKSTWCQCPATS